MKLHLSHQRNQALTRFEVMVVVLMTILLLFVLLSMLLPVEAAARRRAERLNCVNNLKQIVQAAPSWERNPTLTGSSSVTGLNPGQKAWINFAGESNLLASAKILRCPADHEKPDGPPGFNIRISYFVNLNAKKTYPQSVLFGDDNLTIGSHIFGLDRPSDSLGVPGNADLPLRAGVWDVSTNLPVAWDRYRHDLYFVGNAAFADGSVSELSASGLFEAFQQNGPTTNRLAIP